MLVLMWAFIFTILVTIVTGSFRWAIGSAVLALFFGYLIYTGVYN